MYEFDCDDALRRVVRLEALVAAQPDGHRLVAAVHRHEVQVDVDRQVALGDALVHLDELAVRRLAEHDHAVGIAAVVVVEAIGPVLVPHLLADHPLDLPVVHPAVQAERDDDVDVVDAVVGEHLAHDLEHELRARPACA